MARKSAPNACEWQSLTSEQKAKVVGLGGIYEHALKSIALLPNGTWDELDRYHLIRDNKEYRVKLSWMDLNPTPLLAISRYALDATLDFSYFIGCGDVLEEFRARIVDLHERLLTAEEVFEKFMYTRWP